MPQSSPERRKNQVVAVVEAWNRSRTQESGPVASILNGGKHSVGSSLGSAQQTPTQSTLVDAFSEPSTTALDNSAAKAALDDGYLASQLVSLANDKKKGTKQAVLWTNVSHRRNANSTAGSKPASIGESSPQFQISGMEHGTSAGGRSGRGKRHPGGSSQHYSKEDKLDRVVRGRQQQTTHKEKGHANDERRSGSRGSQGRRSLSAPALRKDDRDDGRSGDSGDADPAKMNADTLL
ncbi:hypothetical protein HDU93_006993, partial [Gonapodya sp. JEL0774]